MTDRSKTATENLVTKCWYDKSYELEGFSAQRRYPNEELLRFISRYYGALPEKARRDIRILEVGCGSGANLWMLAREQYDAYGVDLSDAALKLCREMLVKWNVTATLAEADMTSIPFPDSHFDAIVDIYAAYCLPESLFEVFLGEVRRLLKPGGRFFSFAPGKASDAFINPGPSKLLDASTLDGIHRETSAYYGNLFPVRFISRQECADAFRRHGLATVYSEILGRTYRDGQEYFETISMVGELRE